MAEKNTTTNLELAPIPKFKELTEVLDCSNCMYRDNCKYSPTRYSRYNLESKMQCKRYENAFWYLKIFGGLAIQILIGLLTWFIFKRFLVTAGVIIALWAVMFFLENKFDKFIKGKSKQTEKNRLTNHEKEVEKIEASNLAITRQINGETEEYVEFKEKISDILKSLSNNKDSILGNIHSYSTEEEKIVSENFNSLIHTLELLETKITPKNFEEKSVQVFYMLHLNSLKEYSEKYIKLMNSVDDELTQNQKIEFADLLRTFKSKADLQIKILKEIDEEDFIQGMKNLSKSISDIDSESEE